tara:strand:+ start:275 stop:1231 length:957 start_codon:yes stop_codon:yes gene_type:complete
MLLPQFNEIIEHRNKHYEITATLETINAGRAKQLLSTTIGNRRTAPAQIARFTEAMLSHEWATLFDPIRISDSRKLLDGHHRLESIANSNSELRTLVLTGFPETIFEYMDQGQPRTLNDTFHLDGRLNAAKLAGAAKFLYNMLSQKTEYIDVFKPSNQVGMKVLRAHSGLEQSVVEALSICGPNGIQAPLAPVAVVHYLLHAKYGFHDIVLKDFFDTLQHSPSNAVDKSAVNLRNKLQREWQAGRKRTGSKVTWDSTEVLSWFCQAWLSHLEGKPVKAFANHQHQPSYVSYILELAKSIDAGLQNGYTHSFLAEKLSA